MNLYSGIFAAGVWLLMLVVPSCGQTAIMDRRDTISLPNSLAYLDHQLNASIAVNTTLVLTHQISFSVSFRTCSQGELLYQRGGSGDWVRLSINHQGALVFSWWQSQTGQNGSQTLGDESLAFDRNQWFTVDTQFLQGVLTLRVEQGSQNRYSALLSNSTYRRFLWDLNLAGGTPLMVGRGFTGCLQEGLRVALSANDTVGVNVSWNKCPLSSQQAPGCVEDGPDPCWSYPCSNGGTCLRHGMNYTCTCPLPYSGAQCELDLGDQGCYLGPCQNGGTCQPRSTGTRKYHCTCPAGFTGVNCENEIRECASLPCQNGGHCLDQVNGYICNCSYTGYKGNHCEININECMEAPPCAQNAKCVDTPGSFRCQCPAGYAGRTCDTRVEECGSQPCQNNGTCEEHLGYYVCRCAAGFTGINCEVNINDCTATSCPQPNTMCVDGVLNFTCVCKPGFLGDPGRCMDIDECQSQPCRNAATCVNMENAYRCICPAGFTGLNCESNINECASDPCRNSARCRDQIAGFTCDCLLGYTGATCETNINECQSSPCQNNATCIDLVDGYNCSCKLGWEGRHCQFNIDECASNPCVNGAKCSDMVNGYNCTCLPGFTGVRCEINHDECASSPCMNGATCQDKVNSYECHCTATWMGTTCNKVYNACSLMPCKNGATCSTVAPSRNYTCFCPSGFTGQNCQTNIDDCVGHNCSSFQVCVDGVNEYRCSCPVGFTGSKCDTQIDECKSNPCLHGGTCIDQIGSYTCLCPGATVNLTRYTNNTNAIYKTGFTGDNCEIAIDECKYDPPICLNDGLCENSNTSFTCLCRNLGGIYFIGPYCEKRKEYCEIVEEREKCQNGATCKSFVDGFDCICAPGFKGPKCEIDINECLSNPCQYQGNCTDLINGYSCQCVPGITGPNCDVNINECDSNPCQHGGYCLDMINRYECNCTDTGFKGAYCEINIDDCVSDPCINGGNCTDLVKDFNCTCYPAYTGKMCEMDIAECASSPCHNGGQCTERSLQTGLPWFSYSTAHGYDCRCVPGFTGANCETNIDECASSPCKFGQCIDGINRYSCICIPGYTGVHCDVEINECDLYKPCRNQASCVDLLADYRCNCPDEKNGTLYGGKNCSVEMTGCNINACQNGAKCKPYLVNEIYMIHNYTCKCTAGFTDFYCNVPTTMSLDGTGQVIIPGSDAEFTADETYIKLSFRTTLPNGVLFVALGYDPTQTMSLKIQDGSTVQLTYQTAIEGAKATISDPSILFNNSYWQTIEIRINGIDGIILSLNQTIAVHPKEKIYSPFQFQQFYIGGTLFGEPEKYVGCIRDVTLGKAIVRPELYAGQGSSMAVGCLRTDQCNNPDPCNGNGLCQDLWFSYKCYCRRPYLGENCNNSYVAATFGYHGESSAAKLYIPAMTAESLKTSARISLFVRTRKADGLIFYLGSDLDPVNPVNLTYIAAVISNSNLYIIIKLSAENQALPFNNSINIADGKQHLIRLHWNRTRLDIGVDAAFQTFNNIKYQLNLNASYIQFGAMQASGSGRRKRQAPEEPQQPWNAGSFKGTIQDFRLGDTPIQFYPVNDTEVEESLVIKDMNNVKQGEVSDDVCTMHTPCVNNATCNNIFFNDYRCVCLLGFRGKNCSDLDYCVYTTCPGANSSCVNRDDGFECVSTATFDGSQSMIEYQDMQTQDMTSLKMTFKWRTRKANGTMLHIGANQQYVTIAMHRGYVEITYNLGDMVENISIYPFQIDTTDAEWNEGEFVFGLDYISYKVNKLGRSTPAVSYRLTKQNHKISSLLQGNARIFVGGSNSSYVSQHPQMFINGDFYKGCLREMRIGGRLLPFFTDEVLGNNTSSTQFSIAKTTRVLDGCLGDPVCEADHCQNNATCEDIFNDYLCHCLPGFNGTYCQHNIDDCYPGACLNSGICLDRVMDFSCACVPGFTGKQCQINVDECASSPCRNNGTCVDKNNSYSCSCKANYTGDFCQFALTDNCDTKPCENNGTCIPVNATATSLVSFNCSCKPGYTGLRCENETDYCEAHPCHNNATCISHTDQQTYSCLCPNGYTGTDCETNINECYPSPCANNATCTDLVGNYSCSCSSGWTGQNCTDDINECNSTTNVICQKGECVNTNGSYYCNCTGTGYAGVHCETQINECNTTEDLCQNNSTCYDTEGSYQCNCSLGYEGDHCEMANCSHSQCFNGGTCEIHNTTTVARPLLPSGVTAWKCKCPAYYEGLRCETRGPCVDAPCQNNATCVQNGDKYSCNCSSGWQGQNCSDDIDECLSNPCLHGATCQNKNGSYACLCPPGFTGVKCETDISECASQPCQHGGTCTEPAPNSYQCHCSSGYTGVNCETDIDECLDEESCKNNGTCVNKPGSYICECPDDYLGDTCQFLDPCVTPESCLNGATCTPILRNNTAEYECYCAAGYEGPRCEKADPSVQRVEKEEYWKLQVILGVVIGVGSLIILIGIIAFIIVAKNKRATRGTYSPSRQEMSGSRVEMGNVLKPPPEERLI